MNTADRPLHDVAASWVEAMLTLLSELSGSTCSQPLKERLEKDRRQFKALANHLEMLQSTLPVNPWENYHWTLNFAFFLSQLIRNSEQLFQHLATEPEAASASLRPSLVADLFRFIRLANRLPNLY